MPADDPLEARLRAATRFSRLLHLRSCSSTQDVAAAPDHRDGGDMIVWADHQQDGRGRQGRAWHGAAGQDLELTFRVRGLALGDPAVMATAVPAAFVPALERASERPLSLKWPNDILHRGRKLSGVLIDVQGNPPDTWLIGLGVNVNRQSFPPELRERATSLALVTGRTFDRAELVLELARELDRSLTELESGDHARLEGVFRDRMACVGRRVRLLGPSIDATDRLLALDLHHARLSSGRALRLAQLSELRLA